MVDVRLDSAARSKPMARRRAVVASASRSSSINWLRRRRISADHTRMAGRNRPMPSAQISPSTASESTSPPIADPHTAPATAPSVATQPAITSHWPRTDRRCTRWSRRTRSRASVPSVITAMLGTVAAQRPVSAARVAASTLKALRPAIATHGMPWGAGAILNQRGASDGDGSVSRWSPRGSGACRLAGNSSCGPVGVSRICRRSGGRP